MSESAIMNEVFRKFAAATSRVLGSSWAFIIAVLLVIAWALTGPLFGFSDTWQLVINTGTTIVTFLMVFLIQNTQNRESAALQAKLDELIHAIENADTRFVGIEHLTDKELERVVTDTEARAGADAKLAPERRDDPASDFAEPAGSAH